MPHLTRSWFEKYREGMHVAQQGRASNRMYGMHVNQHRQRLSGAALGTDGKAGVAVANLSAEQQAAQYLNALFDLAPDAMVVTDDEGRYVEANPAACQLFGVPREQLLGRLAAEFCQPVGERLPGYDTCLNRDSQRGEYRLQRSDGSVRYAEYSVAQHFVRGQHIAILRDVTEIRSLQETVFEIAQGVAAEIGADFFRSLVLHLCRVLQVDAAFVAMLDVKARTLQTLAVRCRGEAIDNALYPLAGTPCAGAPEHEVCLHPAGARQHFPADPLLAELGAEGFYGRVLFDASGKPLGLLAVADGEPLRDLPFIETIMRIFSVRAVSELQRNQAEQQLHHHAYYDSLTGLPNRMLFNDRLQQALVLAKRSGEKIGVMFLDMDRLKMVNDTFGHACGDALLLAFGERVRRCVREGDTLARLGGDEFTVILRNIGTVSNAAAVAEKMLGALKQPMLVNGNELYVTVSIGISVCPEDGEDMYALLRRADSAMYRSKNQGGNTYHFSQGGVG